VRYAYYIANDDAGEQVSEADPRTEPLIELTKEHWFKSEKCMLCADKFTVFHRQVSDEPFFSTSLLSED